ncbi:MAG: ribosome small subunit-dependent GTPase A [Candidatus Izemoplasmatales bacterium]|nr:ribosome small subunit-dependent GTPase A [Candidatus Izemoplasmatales bacterium]
MMCLPKKGEFIIETNLNPGMHIGTVIAVYRERYLVEIGEEKHFMEVSGRYRYLHNQKSDYPQVGDLVHFHMADEWMGIIESVGERRSILSRADVGSVGEQQILAVNVDLVFLCLSLNKDFHPKKLRNFLTITYGQNFETIILLTKKDLCDDPAPYVAQVQHITDVPMMIVSAFDHEDLQKIREAIGMKTAVLIGSSGVGKSTILNRLLGEERFDTKTIRMSDAQGRHTTVNREMVQLDGGGAVIDTPGIRVVSSYIVDEGVFEDVTSLSEGCLFRDCTHTVEPGCMVIKAIEDGTMEEERFEQFQKATKLNDYYRRREQARNRIIEHRLKKR